MSARVHAPDGHTWVVRRRWVPRLGNESLGGRFLGRVRGTMRRTSDVADADPTGCVDGIGEGFVVAIALIIALLLLLFVAIPLLVAIVDLLIVLLIFLLSLAARVVFRRPWLVEARADNGLTWRWRVVGWRASGEKVTEIAQLLSTGAALPVGAVPG